MDIEEWCTPSEHLENTFNDIKNFGLIAYDERENNGINFITLFLQKKYSIENSIKEKYGLKMFKEKRVWIKKLLNEYLLPKYTLEDTHEWDHFRGFLENKLNIRKTYRFGRSFTFSCFLVPLSLALIFQFFYLWFKLNKVGFMWINLSVTWLLWDSKILFQRLKDS